MQLLREQFCGGLWGGRIDLDLFKLLPLLLLPPPLLAREYERPCIITAFIPLAMEKDFRWLLMVTGSGSLSIRCTGVQETMARQHRSCRLNTGGRKKTDSQSPRDLKGCLLPAAILYNVQFLLRRGEELKVTAGEP